MMQDSIDFGTMNIPKLFRMMFIPTLLGMVLSATINIADGIFVGRGVGSDALAAVNIVAPFFMLATGIGLMFGVGASIVASIHLSHQKVKVANINITQALSVSLCIGEFYQFNLSSCIRQQNSLTAQFVSFSLANLANIFYPPQFLQ